MSANAACTIRLDGRELEVAAGESLLAAALASGRYIPHLCFHRDLPPARSVSPVDVVFRAGEGVPNDGGDEPYPGCGLCAVEVEGLEEPQPACEVPVSAGMVVRGDTPKLQALRQSRLAKLLAHHPHACITCAQKVGCSREPCSTDVAAAERCCPLLGRCELEKLASHIGVPADTPRYLPRGLPAEKAGGLFAFEPELCVGCLRCVRACGELKGVEAMGFVWSDGEVVVGWRASDRMQAWCRSCGACVEVCPTGALTDRVAVAGAREEQLVPCRTGCPAGMDVPRFLRAVARGDADEAARVSLDRLPLPSVLGRVCFHPCEDRCRRAEQGGALSVCRLRRHVFDTIEVESRAWPASAANGARVAVIGSGPAGLSAAHFLRRLGHQVTVFEAAPEAGGMLRYGIPAYRLPRGALDGDLERLVGQGIELRLGMALGRELSLNGLRDDGCQAVLLAAGAGAAKPLPVVGTSLAGVFTGIELLRDVALGTPPAAELEGRRVLVIGGGNVAVDAARTALRLGASEVSLACLEAAHEMPAYPGELEEARAEGVTIRSSWGPAEILGAPGRVRGVRLLRCVAVFDERGRFAPSFDESTSCEVEADSVIVAIGQEVERGLRELPELVFGADGLLRLASGESSAGESGLFAAGDLVHGPSSVVRSVASGRRAAEAIDRFLGGRGDVPSILTPENPAHWIGRQRGFGDRRRVEPFAATAAERIRGFSEVESSIGITEAVAEAGRCLQCDLRLLISGPALPPIPWLELTADAVAAVPPTEGVYQLLGEDRVAVKIAGAPNLRRALGDELAAGAAAPYFLYEEDPMYTKRESELIQQFLAQHGRMPDGEEELDELF